jgi:seryl-tRNA synthetase
LWQRVVLVVGLGVVLCAVLAQVAFNQYPTLLDESITDGDLINTDDDGVSVDESHLKEASRNRLAAKAQALNKAGPSAAKKLKPLSPEQRKQVQERVKKIKAQIKAAEKKATAYDKELLDKTATWRTQLIHAKTLRRDGDDFESEARMVTSNAII